MPQPSKPTIDIRYIETNENGYINTSIDQNEGPVLIIPVNQK